MFKLQKVSLETALFIERCIILITVWNCTIADQTGRDSSGGRRESKGVSRFSTEAVPSITLLRPVGRENCVGQWRSTLLSVFQEWAVFQTSISFYQSENFADCTVPSYLWVRCLSVYALETFQDMLLNSWNRGDFHLLSCKDSDS